MRVAVLGPVRAYADDGVPLDVGGPRLRALLARLALSASEVVSTDALVDGLWGESPPDEAVKALHALVYRLRKVVGAGVVESQAAGYRLRVRGEDVDLNRFEDLAVRGRRHLAGEAFGEAAAVLGEALGLWQGPALADVLDAPFSGTAAARLEELRIAAAEDRFEAELALGHHGEILADLEASSAEHPLRERLAALRMRALHAAGRQSEALAAFEQVRSTLADQLGVDPSPELRRAQLAVLRGERRTKPPAQATHGRLPAALTSFVGRKEDLKLLAGLLESSRLVTITGPGGTGKTRLALEAASRHRVHRRGRAWLVSLADATTPDGVAEAVLGVLSSSDIRTSGRGPAEPVDRIAELLGGGEAILILDNCEQVVAAAADLARRLLERQPYLTILATSREPLQMMGEAICRLGPLPQPSAVRLFTDRAAAVRPGFEPGDATLEIVRRLDGLPLALELAAARLRTMTPDQIVARLDDRFRLLASGNRTAGPRQQTLHAVIDWSWDLLTHQEQVLARRLSVFPSKTGIAAIEAVCSDHILPAGDVAYLLDSLIDKSIVEDGHRMLETIRAYAAEKLHASGEHRILRTRFIRHFADLAEHHEPLLRTDKQPESLRLFGAEYDNLVFALRLAIENGDAVDAARILGPLYWYWIMLGHDPRAQTFAARVLELGDALPEDARAAFTAIHAFAEGPPSDADRVRAMIEDCARTGALERYPLLMAVMTMGHLAGLDDLVQREMARVRNGSDPWASAMTYVTEAFIGYERGDWERATTAQAAALRAFEEVGDPWWTAMLLATVAQTHAVRGDNDAAIADYERSVALLPYEETGHRLGLAIERMRAGDLDGARRDIEAAERTAWERGQRHLEIQALATMAELHRRSGEIERSDHELDRMEMLARENPLLDEATTYLVRSARTANRLTTGDAAGARELLPPAIHNAQAQGDLAPAAQQLARLLYLEGDPAGAATALGMSEVIRGAFDHGDPELRRLTTELIDRLGRAGYDRAFRQGARMPRQDAIGRLTGAA